MNDILRKLKINNSCGAYVMMGNTIKSYSMWSFLCVMSWKFLAPSSIFFFISQINSKTCWRTKCHAYGTFGTTNCFQCIGNVINFIMFLWSIWQQRNSMIWENKTTEYVEKFTSYKSSYKLASNCNINPELGKLKSILMGLTSSKPRFKNVYSFTSLFFYQTHSIL